MKTYYKLFLLFFKIGIFSFGGGYAMLPMLKRELAEKRNYVTETELYDFYAVSQCTPGIIAVNVATMIGYRKRGFFGALFSTLGVILPSFIIICIIASVLTNFSSLPLVQKAFVGIRACVCALIAEALISLYKKAIIDKACIFIALLIFVLSFFISPVLCTLLAGAIGVFIKMRKGKSV